MKKIFTTFVVEEIVMYTRLFRSYRLVPYKHNNSILHYRNMASSLPVQLTADERVQHIDPLVEAGWSLVEAGSS